MLRVKPDFVSPTMGPLPPDGVPLPFTTVQSVSGVGPATVVHNNKVPNPAYGAYFGMEWDGERWVRIDPNRDFRIQMEREKAQMELERAKQEMAHENWKREQEKRVTDWAIGRQMNDAVGRSGLGPAQDDQRPWKYSPGKPGGFEYTDTPQYQDAQMQARKMQIAREQANYAKQQPQGRKNPNYTPYQAGRAEPIQPPDQGTPYGSAPKPAAAYGFKPPAPGSSNAHVMQWWHNPATGEETQATAGSMAPPGWVQGRAGEGVRASFTPQEQLLAPRKPVPTPMVARRLPDGSILM